MRRDTRKTQRIAIKGDVYLAFKRLAQAKNITMQDYASKLLQNELAQEGAIWLDRLPEEDDCPLLDVDFE